MPVVAINASLVVGRSLFAFAALNTEITNYKLQISQLLRRLDLPITRPYPQFFEAVHRIDLVERQLCLFFRRKT
jgi:hypothetical protein